jgi:phage gpG-like protein
MKITNNIPQHQAKVIAALKKLPKKLATEAVEHFDKSFEDQGFDDNGIVKWQKRKVNTSKNGKQENASRGILMLTGGLRRSIKSKVQGNQIAVYSDSPYAAIHNDGLLMKNGKPMPKRQFIGKSANLNTKLIKIINNTLKGI